jgi:hypothetical protein
MDESLLRGPAHWTGLPPPWQGQSTSERATDETPEFVKAIGHSRSGPSFQQGRRHARLILMLGVIWNLLTLPIRLVVWVLDFLSRATGLGLGFALMVLGVALGAGSWLVLGVPIFVVGLILTLKCLG